MMLRDNMKSVEKTGKTVDNAITDALIELGATTDEVEIQVLERGSKGLPLLPIKIPIFSPEISI